MNWTPRHIDTLTELINTGMERAAGFLNEMLHTHIELRVTRVCIFENQKELEQFWQGESNAPELAAVGLRFSRGFNGGAVLLFPPDGAVKLVTLVSGEAHESQHRLMDDLRIGALTEVGNIVLNNLLGMISSLLQASLRVSFPRYQEGLAQQVLAFQAGEEPMARLLANVVFNVQSHHIEGYLLLLLDPVSLHKLLTDNPEIEESDE